MREILLVRHAKSYVNEQDLAFGNKESPLNDKGIVQALGLAAVFEARFGIVPSEYEKPVLSSEYTRAQQTAELAGFRNIVTNSLINEGSVEDMFVDGQDVKLKHAKERWAPQELSLRTRVFVNQVREGELDYQVYFAHGLFIATTLLELSEEAEKQDREFPHEFSETRGFIPANATIIALEI